jgi:hypothetical protein
MGQRSVQEESPTLVDRHSARQRQADGDCPLDPQLNTGTRTAKIRVEVPNPRGDLRLGMYTDVEIASPGTAQVLSVPKDAVQSVGGRFSGVEGQLLRAR